MCAFNVCECVRLFSNACNVLGVCVLGANMVKAGGNQIGYDPGWQVLQAIVITPVSVNHISDCVLPHTLPA